MLDLNTLKRIDPNTLNEQSFKSIMDEIVANNDVVAYCFVMDKWYSNDPILKELLINKIFSEYTDKLIGGDSTIVDFLEKLYNIIDDMESNNTNIIDINLATNDIERLIFSEMNKKWELDTPIIKKENPTTYSPTKISEMISALKEIQKEHGDITILNEYDASYSIGKSFSISTEINPDDILGDRIKSIVL